MCVVSIVRLTVLLAAINCFSSSAMAEDYSTQSNTALTNTLGVFGSMKLRDTETLKGFVRGEMEINNWNVDRRNRSLDYNLWRSNDERDARFNLTIGKERKALRKEGVYFTFDYKL